MRGWGPANSAAASAGGNCTAAAHLAVTLARGAQRRPQQPNNHVRRVLPPASGRGSPRPKSTCNSSPDLDRTRRNSAGPPERKSGELRFKIRGQRFEVASLFGGGGRFCCSPGPAAATASAAGGFPLIWRLALAKILAPSQVGSAIPAPHEPNENSPGGRTTRKGEDPHLVGRRGRS